MLTKRTHEGFTERGALTLILRFGQGSLWLKEVQSKSLKWANIHSSSFQCVLHPNLVL